MFVQVIQGHVSDAEQVRAQLDKWVAEVAHGAVGRLGSTSGVTEDCRLIALARFESGEAAQRNGDRPEQKAWWEEKAALFTDPVDWQVVSLTSWAQCLSGTTATPGRWQSTSPPSRQPAKASNGNRRRKCRR